MYNVYTIFTINLINSFISRLHTICNNDKYDMYEALI